MLKKKQFTVAGWGKKLWGYQWIPDTVGQISRSRFLSRPRNTRRRFDHSRTFVAGRANETHKRRMETGYGFCRIARCELSSGTCIA
jgi:hypothetical protein